MSWIILCKEPDYAISN